MNKGENLVAGAVVYRKTSQKTSWLLVKRDKDADWGFPKETVHKSESSVKAAIRMMGEIGGMRTVVIEEAGQAKVTTTKNGREVKSRIIFYLMQQRAGGEGPGFYDVTWLEYSQASKKLALEREKRILRQAKEVLSQWQKEHPTG